MFSSARPAAARTTRKTETSFITSKSKVKCKSYLTLAIENHAELKQKRREEKDRIIESRRMDLGSPEVIG